MGTDKDPDSETYFLSSLSSHDDDNNIFEDSVPKDVAFGLPLEDLRRADCSMCIPLFFYNALKFLNENYLDLPDLYCAKKWSYHQLLKLRESVNTGNCHFTKDNTDPFVLAKLGILSENYPSFQLIYFFTCFFFLV